MMLHGLLRALLSSFLGTLGFAVLLHSPRRAIIPASIVGAAAYLLYWLLLTLGAPEYIAVFMGALCGSLSAQWLARRMHMIATVFVLLSIVAAVPGLGLYRCMELLGASSPEALAVGVSAMVSIVMIVLGIGMGSFLFRAALSLKYPR